MLYAGGLSDAPSHQAAAATSPNIPALNKLVCPSEEGCQDGTGNTCNGLGCVHSSCEKQAAGPTSALTKSAKSCSHCLSATVSKAEPTSPMTTGKRRPL